MDSKKKIMKMNELQKMGYPRTLLLRAYRSHKQNFARKINPTAKNSPIIFDVDEFEKWLHLQYH